MRLVSVLDSVTGEYSEHTEPQQYEFMQDRSVITADGVDFATVTYYDEVSGNTTVTLTVNGVATVVPLVNGQAVVEITAALAGTVTITGPNCSCEIKAV